jgi:hypothetical protein
LLSKNKNSSQLKLLTWRSQVETGLKRDGLKLAISRTIGRYLQLAGLKKKHEITNGLLLLEIAS